MDITSYILGKKAGGGNTPTGTINITENGTTNVSSYATADVNVQPKLESKEITITENTTTTITPTSGKDGLSSVEITTNVVSGDDWSDIGYSSTPKYIADTHAYSKQLYDNWNPNSPTKFTSDTNLVICPLVDTSKMTNMQNMFQNCRNLRNVPALNTSRVTTMNQMFDSYGFKEITCDFDTSRVSDFVKMFLNCSSLTTINFGNNFTFEKATSMFYMFSNDYQLDNNTLNQILYLCTTTTSAYTEAKKLSRIGITSSFTNYNNIPNLSNYQAFIDAGWSIS